MKVWAVLLGGAAMLVMGGWSTAIAAPAVTFSASASADAGFSFMEPNLVVEDNAVQDSQSASSQPGVTSFQLNAATPDVQRVQTLKDPEDDPSLQVVQTWDTKASASGTGSVGFGELHARLTAQTQVNFLATLEGFKPDPDNPGQQIPFSKTFISPIGAEAHAGVSETSFDLLTVNANADHRAGTLVPIKLTLVVHASGSAPAVTELGQTFQGGASIDVTTSIAGHNQGNGNAVIPDISQQVNGAVDLTETGTVNVAVGTAFPIEIQLGAGVSAGGIIEADSCGYICSVAPGEFASLDIGNTISLFVDPLSDFTINTASGHDYSTPLSNVPEPPALPLLATGLLSVAVLRSRLRKRVLTSR